MSHEERVVAHCVEIERCNQRGGRMLSVVDLVQAGTLDLDLAAYLAARISRGFSFLVGALPGGVGKTTVMGALLNFVPAECRLAPADSGATVRRALPTPGDTKTCYICHEIGAGPYFAYLWGQDARDYFALARAGSMIATNLHADTLDQCREQLLGHVGVREEDFRHCRLCLFVHGIGRRWSDPRRRIVTVHESDGRGPHRRVWQWNPHTDGFDRVATSQSPDRPDSYCVTLRGFLAELVERGISTIEQVRSRFLRFAEANPPRPPG